MWQAWTGQVGDPGNHWRFLVGVPKEGWGSGLCSGSSSERGGARFSSGRSGGAVWRTQAVTPIKDRILKMSNVAGGWLTPGPSTKRASRSLAQRLHMPDGVTAAGGGGAIGGAAQCAESASVVHAKSDSVVHARSNSVTHADQAQHEDETQNEAEDGDEAEDEEDEEEEWEEESEDEGGRGGRG